MDHSQLIQRSHTLYIIYFVLAMEFGVGVYYFSPLKPSAFNSSFEDCNNRAAHWRRAFRKA